MHMFKTRANGIVNGFIILKQITNVTMVTWIEMFILILYMSKFDMQ